MPLIKGKSPESFSKNVRTEMDVGKSQPQSLAIAYAMKRKAQKMAHGGLAQEEQESGYQMMPCKMCEGGSCPKHMMAKGGFIEDEKSSGYLDMPEAKDKMNPMADEEDDMVSRIMKRRMMSEGGRVANEDHGPNDNRLAEFSPNEFDDLSMRDDLDSSYTGANSGDEIGDEQEDEDKHDIVSRIMKSRKMNDKMPIPGYGTSYGRYK